MTLRLENVSMADRAVLSDIIARANFDDPYGQIVWPGSTLASRYRGTYSRLPKTLLSPGNWFMKCVDPTTDTIIAYAQWTLPLALWERLRAEHDGGAQAGVTDEMRAVFEREHAESCTSEGEPKGLRMEVVEFCTPAQSKANARCFPFEGGYIMLVQVKTLPAHQRRGAGQLLTQWGVDLANREGLTTCLESTPFGRRLYEKCGFQAKEDVVHDLSRFGGPREYAWTMMVKEPEEKVE